MKVNYVFFGMSICLTAFLSASATRADESEVKFSVGGGAIANSKAGAGPQGSASLEVKATEKSDRQGSFVLGGSAGVIDKTAVGHFEIVGAGAIGAGGTGREAQMRLGGTVIDATSQFMRLSIPIAPGARIMNNNGQSHTDISVPFLTVFQDRQNHISGFAPGVSVSTEQKLSKLVSFKAGADLHYVQGGRESQSKIDTSDNGILGLGDPRITQNGAGTFFSLNTGLAFHVGQNVTLALEARYDGYNAKAAIRNNQGHTIDTKSVSSEALTGVATATVAF